MMCFIFKNFRNYYIFKTYKHVYKSQVYFAAIDFQKHLRVALLAY